MVEVTKLSAFYGKKEILNDISLTFEKGEISTIIGPNGCGKTTLLNALTATVKPKGGTVLIDGENICQLKRKALARKISYLVQGQKVPDMTVGQIVLHGRYPHTGFSGIYSKKDKAFAYSAMEKMELLDLVHLPLSVLSGGMRQNVFIAMALCQDTDYIFLDEPTTYLDIANQTKLLTLLRKLTSDGKGIITVLHDLPLALSFSDKIAVMNEGKIKTFDTPSNIYASGIIKTVFGTKIMKEENRGNFYFCFDK